jgi:putative addiction module killer protein
MYRLVQSTAFDRWLSRLADRKAAALINARLRRLQLGHLGDMRHVGDGIREMRIHHGPGYRLYLIFRPPAIVVLLAGGSKGSQSRDIDRARHIAVTWDKSQ